MGLLVMAGGGSVELDGGTHLTYYEPTANWLMLLALLGTDRGARGRDAARALDGARPCRC